MRLVGLTHLFIIEAWDEIRCNKISIET